MKTASGCRELTSFGIDITAIWGSTFAHCSHLEQLCFPQKLRRIGQEAFLLCSSLHEVRTPPASIYIVHRAFLGCTQLSRLIKMKNKATWRGPYVERDTFELCDKLHMRLRASGWLPWRRNSWSLPLWAGSATNMKERKKANQRATAQSVDATATCSVVTFHVGVPTCKALRGPCIGAGVEPKRAAVLSQKLQTHERACQPGCVARSPHIYLYIYIDRRSYVYPQKLYRTLNLHGFRNSRPPDL